MAAETRKEQIGFDAYDILKQAEQDGGGAGRADRADRAGRQNRQASNRGQDGTPLDKSSARKLSALEPLYS